MPHVTKNCDAILNMSVIKVFVVILCIIIEVVHSRSQPHIVLIVADDVGWNDVGFHGSNQIPTPNIDALAYNGVILNRFYTLPICTPSRTALLTGQYPIRSGLHGKPIASGENRHLLPDIPTLPEKLKELGYATNLIGKWHLGAAYKNVTPTSRGFDHHFGYWNGAIGYFNHESGQQDMVGLDMHDKHEPMWHTQGEYATGLLTRKAEEVIGAHNGSEPLFLMVAHLAAHTGIEAELEVPDVAENDKKFNYIADEKRRLFAGVMTELDKSVGNIVEALSKKGILDDTIIIFVSDNGAPTEGVYDNRGSNWPLRGLKLSLHDGGVRTVALLYSSQIKNNGVVNKELLHITDLMPTLYAAAGGNVTDLGKIDGINQWDTLTSNKKSNRSEILLNIDEVENSSGLIGENGRYKLINGSTILGEMYDRFYGEDGRDSSSPPYDTEAVLHSTVNGAIGGKLIHSKIQWIRRKADLGNCRNSDEELTYCTYHNFCLFDLYDDPCETTDIAENFPEIVGKLQHKLAGYWEQVRPQKAKFVDPKANPIYYNNTWYTWLDEDYVLLFMIMLVIALWRRGS